MPNRQLTLCWISLVLFFNAFNFIACQKMSDDSALATGGRTVVKSITNNVEFDDVIASSHQKLVVVDFYADWCGPCRELAPLLENVAGKMESNAEFYKVNIDEHRTLSMKNGVTGIPYVAFFKNGKKVHSLMGIWPKKDYIRSIEKYAIPFTKDSLGTYKISN
ncbi:MAG: thioredoxin [Desulfobacteraceae bacterium]|jgi:thioredoxin 1